MILRLTTIGRQTLADGANRQTRAVTLTRLAAGSGSGPGGAADDARTTLRNERASAAATGATALAGRLVARGDLMPTAAWNVTEVGLFAQVGAAPEILLAYWTKGGDVLAAATPGVTLVLAAVIEIQAAAAEIKVILNPAVTVTGASTFLGLTDTPAAFVAGRLLRANAAADALEGLSLAQLAAILELDAGRLVSGRVPAARLGVKRYAVALTDVVNTRAVTNAIAFQLAAGEMGDGDRITIDWFANTRNASGSDRNYTYRLHWGAASAVFQGHPRRADNDPDGYGDSNYSLKLWRRGASLYFGRAPGAAQFVSDWDEGEPPMTPAFDAAATVAFSVQLQTAHQQFYYRPRAAIAERTKPGA